MNRMCRSDLAYTLLENITCQLGFETASLILVFQLKCCDVSTGWMIVAQNLSKMHDPIILFVHSAILWPSDQSLQIERPIKMQQSQFSHRQPSKYAELKVQASCKHHIWCQYVPSKAVASQGIWDLWSSTTRCSGLSERLGISQKVVHWVC